MVMLYIMYTVRSHDIRLSIAVHAFQSIFLKYGSNGWSRELIKEKYKYLDLNLQKRYFTMLSSKARLSSFVSS